MPLTRDEKTFLDAYVYEVTHGPPFGGPASQDLKTRGIYYQHLSWLLTAYHRELSRQGIPPTGVPTASPPPSPWPNLEQARMRNDAVKEEMELQELVSTASARKTSTGL